MIGGLRPYPDYGTSDVPWADALPKHWESRKGRWLFRHMDRPVREQDEVVTCFRDGLVTLRKNRRLRGFTESIQEIGYQGIRRGDLVIHGMDAFAGAIGVADSDGKGSPVYSVCEANAGFDPRYYALTLREMARNGWIQALAKGIRERSTDFRYESFASQLLPVPPQVEQTAIVRFMDYIDRRVGRCIRAKQNLIGLLGEQKQAIIHRAVTRGLDPSVRLKSSGVEWLGYVPEHWERKRIRACLTDMRAGIWGDDPTTENQADHVVCLRVADFDLARLRVSESKLTTRAVSAGARNSRRLIPGDILLEKSGGGDAEPVGRVVLYDGQVAPHAITSNFIVRLRPDATFIAAEFLLLVLATMQSTRRNVPWIKQTTGIQNLNERAYLSLAIAVPPVAEQEKILARLRSVLRTVDQGIERSTQEINLLREYRTRLIADLVTGEVDVREAAARLPDEESAPVEEVGPLIDADQGTTSEMDAAPNGVMA